MNGKIPGTDKPKLLLHCCCAPCSSATLERIQREYETDIYYYNPNIEPEAEFRKRAAEEERFVAEFRPDGGVKVTVRRRLGSDIDAACGQLRRGSFRNADD